ncbi:MAG TPA: heparinase II/III family protein [Burkholderiaceae bacterium]|nr:heparinase II/III family protein [Burkholderiaceae bacterium]
MHHASRSADTVGSLTQRTEARFIHGRIARPWMTSSSCFPWPHMITTTPLHPRFMSLSVLSLCISLAACGGSDTPEDIAAASTSAHSLESPAALRDTRSPATATGAGASLAGPALSTASVGSNLQRLIAAATTPASAAAGAGTGLVRAPILIGSDETSRTLPASRDTSPTRAPVFTPKQEPTPPRSLWTLPESVTVEGDVSGTTFTASTADALAKRSDIVLSTSRIPKEDWAAAKSKFASVPSWTSWVGRRKALVDDWIGASRDRADLIGGYGHDYNDPKTGIPLAWTPESAEPPDGATDTEIRFKQAWVYFMRAYNLTRTGEAARIYALTGDVKYAEWAARQLDFYATNYNLWPLRTENGRGRMYRHGLDEATGVWDLLDAARLLEVYAGAARVSSWRTGLFQPMAENLKTVTSPLTNIGLWHASGIAGIAMRLHDGALLDYALNNPIGIRATLAAAMTSDYLWDEGSFGYNDYVIWALSNLQVAAGVEGYASSVASERTPLYRLLLSPLDYRFDDGSLPTPGDSAPYNAFTSRSFVRAYRSIPTWWGVQAANASQSWEALMDAPPATPPAPTLPPVTTRNFPGNRMAVLRSGAWQAFVHYGQSRANHWQEEALTYELHFGTVRLSSDPGTVNYSSPYHNDYFRKGPAQNVPLIDGMGQEKWSPGEIDVFDPAEARLVVKHPSYRSGVAVVRGFRTTTQGFVERTSLSTADKSVRRLGIAYHSNCSIRPLNGLISLAVAPSVPATPATAYWTELSAYSAAAKWSIEIDCGGAKFSYMVVGTPNQRVYLGKEPTTPLPGVRPVLYYEVTSDAAVFESTIDAR